MINISIKNGAPASKPMRNILGMNNIPRPISKGRFEHDKPLFDALKLAHIRFHDATLENPGWQIIDISRIFPLFHLDETDERNYHFIETDDYLKQLQGSDAEIDFRLGETIDHSGLKRRIQFPQDIDKWARICRNIVGHYKNGEMNGMHLNITRVSVWEESDNPNLLVATVEQYAEMFCKVYKLIKKDFPDVKVGGPNATSWKLDFFESFIRICKEKGVEPDYISSTIYAREIEELRDWVVKHKEVMDKCGLKNAGYTISEWHYTVLEWGRERYMSENGFRNAGHAAFTAGSLIEMMDLDFLDVAYYYAWATSMWAPFDFLAESMSLMPVYYGLLFFQKLAAECPDRIEITADSDLAQMLCGKTEDGKIRMLISCREKEANVFKIETDGCKAATLKYVSSETGDSPDCLKEMTLSSSDGIFEVEHKGESGVYFIEFDK